MTNTKTVPKSLFWAYFWWLFGGIFGAHHLYLGRDYQFVVWFCSAGGFIVGWIRDLFRIPRYVAMANGDQNYQRWFKEQVRVHKKPPSSIPRFIGGFLFGSLWGQMAILAIPEDEIYGINFKRLMLLVPLAIAFGVWIVGNIGQTRGSIKLPLLAAYLSYPTYYYIPDSGYWLALMSAAAALGFELSIDWRLKSSGSKRQSRKKRVAVVATLILLYCGLWASFFVFNGVIVVEDGEEIKVSDFIEHLFKSPAWRDPIGSIEEVLKLLWQQDFWSTIKEIVDLADPRGENNAYRVLGVSAISSKSEITARWRALSKEHHPDKIKGNEEERRKAEERFMEIQKAYEILSSEKMRRKRKNRKSNE